MIIKIRLDKHQASQTLEKLLKDKFFLATLFIAEPGTETSASSNIDGKTIYWAVEE